MAGNAIRYSLPSKSRTTTKPSRKPSTGAPVYAPSTSPASTKAQRWIMHPMLRMVLDLLAAVFNLFYSIHPYKEKPYPIYGQGLFVQFNFNYAKPHRKATKSIGCRTKRRNQHHRYRQTIWPRKILRDSSSQFPGQKEIATKIR